MKIRVDRWAAVMDASICVVEFLFPNKVSAFITLYDLLAPTPRHTPSIISS